MKLSMKNQPINNTNIFSKLTNNVKYRFGSQLSSCTLCGDNAKTVLWFDTHGKEMNYCQDCIRCLLCIASKNKADGDSFACKETCYCYDGLARQAHSDEMYNSGLHFFKYDVSVAVWNDDRSFSPHKESMCNRCEIKTEELIVFTNDYQSIAGNIWEKYSEYLDKYPESEEDIRKIEEFNAKKEVKLCAKCLAQIAGLVKTRFIFTIIKKQQTNRYKTLFVKRQIVVPKNWSKEIHQTFPLAERQKALFLMLSIKRFEILTKWKIDRNILNQILTSAFRS